MENEVQTSIDRVSIMVIKRGSWLNADTVSTTETVKSNIFPQSGFDIDNRVLLDELEFQKLRVSENKSRLTVRIAKLSRTDSL